jgi:hypothetical protein
MIALGYGKFFKSECIVGLEPIEEGRGPGKRTRVFVEHLKDFILASRSETAILRDLVDRPPEVTQSRQQSLLLADILDTIHGIDPMLRSIIRDQGAWDLDRLEEKIRDVLMEESAVEGSQNQTLPF